MITRRHMLAGAAALSGTAALWPQTLIGAPDEAARRIALTNLHTGERLDIEYFRGGSYAPEALTALDVLLRDFRNGEKHAIDPKLMDYLVDVAARIGVPVTSHLPSGKKRAHSAKPSSTRVVSRPFNRFALPGIALDSWTNVGIFLDRPARIGAVEVNPPMPSTASG